MVRNGDKRIRLHTPPLGLTLTPLPSLGDPPMMDPTINFSETDRCRLENPVSAHLILTPVLQAGSPLSADPPGETCWGLARLHSRVSHECSHFFIQPLCSEHTRVLDFLALQDLQFTRLQKRHFFLTDKAVPFSSKESSHPVLDCKKGGKTCPLGVGEPLFGGASPALADHRTQGTPAGAGCARSGALVPATKHADWR